MLILAFVLAALLFIWPDNRARVRTTMIETWTSVRTVLVAWAVALTGLLLLFASIDTILVTVTGDRTVVGIIKTWLNALFDNFFVFDQTVWIWLPSRVLTVVNSINAINTFAVWISIAGTSIWTFAMTWTCSMATSFSFHPS